MKGKRKDNRKGKQIKGNRKTERTFLKFQRASRSLAKTGFFFSCFAYFSKLFFNIFLKLLLCRLGPFLGPMLGLCWELFRGFFDLKLRSYLKVVFSSIFHRIRAPLEPQKMSSRLGENQKIKILHFLS